MTGQKVLKPHRDKACAVNKATVRHTPHIRKEKQVSYMDNQNFDEKKPQAAGAKQTANRPRRGRPPKKAPQAEGTPAPQSRTLTGSHDILGTPEIVLSAEPSTQPQAGSGETATGSSKPRQGRRPGRKPQTRATTAQSGSQNPPDTAPKSTEAPGAVAPTTAKPTKVNRGRGRKKAQPATEGQATVVATEKVNASTAAGEGNPGKAEPSGKPPVANRQSRSTRPRQDKAANATVTSEEKNPQPTGEKKKSARSGGRRSSVPSVVSARDSIVKDAEIYRHEGHTLRVRKMGGDALTYVPKAKLRIIPLGGLNEVGKNMTVVEYGDDILIIDCGIGFPDEDEMPGIDLVIPDITYLENNRDKIRGIVLTHGHEDHIGAIPYILQKIHPPIYGTRLTLGIIENKLQEHTLPWKADLRCVKAGDVIRLGASFTVEFIHVNHSIADACALAIGTPLGTLVHTGDFKLDLTPIEGEMMDITRLGELGREGVLLLMCESTNAERAGHTPSEKKVGQSLEMIFTMNTDKRIVIATFSSNVHRVQQIIDISARHGRKVAVTGRSMINIVAAAVELGYMKVPDGVLIDLADIRKYRPDQLTLITTGSQGEPMSALYRMAFGDHNQVTLGPSDLVVLSASAIPGNEKLVGRIINELCKMGVKVINDSSVEVHVSGHACQEELKLMQGLTHPRYLMPVHGEYKHMAANRELGLSMGIPSDHIFISDIGKVLEIDEAGAKWGGTVPAGVVLVDGYGVGDVGNIVLRDRKHLSQDGLIVVVATVDANAGLLVSGPDIVSRGFVYVRESEELMEEVRRIAAAAINNCMDRSGCDWYEIKNRIKDDITRFLYSRTKRKPMILPIVMDV